MTRCRTRINPIGAIRNPDRGALWVVTVRYRRVMAMAPDGIELASRFETAATVIELSVPSDYRALVERIGFRPVGGGLRLVDLSTVEPNVAGVFDTCEICRWLPQWSTPDG